MKINKNVLIAGLTAYAILAEIGARVVVKEAERKLAEEKMVTRLLSERLYQAGIAPDKFDQMIVRNYHH